MKRIVQCVLFVSVVCSLLPNAQPTAAATAGQIVRVTLTSNWPTHSPDPMGLTYNAKTKKLLISDSEVDEIPALWKGKNFFIATRGGRLFAARTFKRFTVEPEDLAWDGKDQALFVTDDDLDRVFRVGRGKDKKFGTRDDTVITVLHTRRFGSLDPEGLAWRGGRKPMLIVTDSGDTGPTALPRVYRILRGRDKRFGTRDDDTGDRSERTSHPEDRYLFGGDQGSLGDHVRARHRWWPRSDLHHGQRRRQWREPERERRSPLRAQARERSVDDPQTYGSMSRTGHDLRVPSGGGEGI
ncbi:MAG: hypothetical protein E6G54_06640 [Actinobacteria bacterium]|nr:MAG: hypothetical protein E6G54_06640 [Actinomycetota bacterium]